MNRSRANDERTGRRKSMLFCLECDDASPIDGNWLRCLRDEHVAYVCPGYGTTIVEQP
ncbi:hypothetical protein [Natronobacterium gregoryi]|uniref:DUF8106 domain-containing protein n=2 Tax=Natronobacterium gregoryi TaxID=44930 RepID=L9XPG1_NATGS|nr:hypothetical protein [Natronobacterium gregoryi]ELY63699.1 hypothetical protein C490_15654 [Natronobacterium gregoryi SP2]